MNSKFNFSSIRIRLLLASTLVQAVLLSLLLYNNYQQMARVASASIKTMVSQNAAMLHSMALTYHEQQRLGHLQEILVELLDSADEGLVYVRIGQPDGSLLVSAGLPELTTLPEAQLDFNHIVLNPDEPLIHIRAPLLLDHNHVGFLQFGVSDKMLLQARNAMLYRGGLFALSEIVLTVLLLVSIGILLTRNLHLLLTGSREIAEGNLGYRIPVTGQDEVTALAKRFNLMADKLDDRISLLQNTAAQLSSSEQRYALAMQGANDGLWDWDVQKNIIYVSGRLREILGLEGGDGEIDPALLWALVPAEELEGFKAFLIKHLKSGTEQFSREFHIYRSDGSWRWIELKGVALRGADSRVYRMAGSLGDIEARKQSEAQLLHGALYDALTGLPTRALFIEHVALALHRRLTGQQHCIAILTVNLERFHLVNDSFGHMVGDEVLTQVANRLRSGTKDSDLAARLGGDQFAVLLTRLEGAGGALRMARHLSAMIAEAIDVGAAHVFYPKVRIGIAFDSKDTPDAESLLRDADNALNQARSSIHDDIAVFHTTMHAKALDLLALEAQLRHSILKRALVAYFQPIVTLEGEQIASFEALARWPHAEKGMIMPGAFIDLAASLGLLTELTMQMLDQACSALQQWQQTLNADVPPVSVNISAQQIAKPGFPELFLARLAQHQVSPRLVRIEVTENAIVDQGGLAPAALQRLREQGIQVLIDDFGTGFSALSYLHTLPCDIIKFDGSLIRQLEHNPKLRAIVQRSIELSHDLDMKVVAEWVETFAQVQILSTLRCDFAQGRRFGEAMDADTALKRLVAQQQDTRG